MIDGDDDGGVVGGSVLVMPSLIGDIDGDVVDWWRSSSVARRRRVGAGEGLE